MRPAPTRPPLPFPAEEEVDLAQWTATILDLSGSPLFTPDTPRNPPGFLLRPNPTPSPRHDADDELCLKLDGGVRGSHAVSGARDKKVGAVGAGRGRRRG